MNDAREILYMRPFDGLTERELAGTIRTLAKAYPDATLFKEVFASYGVDGRVSFDVGRQHGVIDLASAEAGLKRIDLNSRDWQKIIHLPGFPDLKPKAVSLMTAEKLFPKAEFRIQTKTGKLSKNEHLGLVDAALIAAAGILSLRKNLRE